MAGSGQANLRNGASLLQVRDLVVEYPLSKGRKVFAVSNVSFDVKKQETLGIVGESGSGKSTMARAIMQLPPPTSGSVVFKGEDLTSLKTRPLRQLRPMMQMIFQDPISSLNPRRKIKDIVAESLRVWGKGDIDHRVSEALDAVGLDVARVSERRPHELSGGQCQRVSIARSLVLDPELLICDEPVSSLDVSVQAKILNLLKDAKERNHLTIVFVSHDLGVIRNISDRVAVVYLGKMCETGAAARVYEAPAHPYTSALLEAVPIPDPEVPLRPQRATGEIPSPLNPPSGCRYHTTCPKAAERCTLEEPQVRQIGEDHFVACHFPNTEGLTAWHEP